jgi:SAM-dependent methyltransferase
MTGRYIGSKLELFGAATNWKRYIADILSRFIAGSVLEVGAGIGANIVYLCGSGVDQWTSLEPDPDLAARISERIRRGEVPAICRVVTGAIDAIDPKSRFDTILYLDVLEHIAEDRNELVSAGARLADGGSLVVLAPAHQFLFSAFDAAIGHYRRYDRASLCRLGPRGCSLEAFLMLDGAGFFASLGNRLMLRAAQPSPRQIVVWDKFLVPASRCLDPLTGSKFGKSALAVWRAAG